MNREKVAEFYKKYELVEEDVFKHKHYLIITRQGIEKIQAKENISIKYDFVESGAAGVVIKAYASKEGKSIETFGSASKDTSHNKYYAEMAEKRAMSRAVLKITGLYEHGVFGEDESDDFKKDD